MNAEDAYRWLIEGSASSRYSAFDLHIVAAILSLAFAEPSAGDGAVLERIGLEKPALMELLADLFPGVHAALDREVGDFRVAIDDEEQSIRDILSMYSTGASYLEKPLSAMIARRCRWPHHLWQDLGLANRSELSMLMRRHFARLADKNRQDMKWKKFLYRMVCGSEGFVLCTAPICSECDDFKNCFGAEDGESMLARARNSSHMAA